MSPCPDCGSSECEGDCIDALEREADEPDGTLIYPKRKLTRNERLQEMADRGRDTWEEYRGER
jgi:hypothetical protein